MKGREEKKRVPEKGEQEGVLLILKKK